MTDSSSLPAQPSGPERLVVQVVLKTDVGLVRSENQDYGILTTPEEEARDGGVRLMMVADGMGGHRGGATASRLAATTVKQELLGSEAGDPAQSIKTAFEKANARIFGEAQTHPELRGMGTTGSALVIRDDQAWFAHVGDSRIYRVRGGEIKQITDDHSLVASMVREGLLTPKEAETHPRRNVLQRSIGVSPDVEVDVGTGLKLEKGDTFILCSDGLHGVVKEDEMRKVASLPIEEAADTFVRLALERGAPDNVTVIVARVSDAANLESITEPISDRTTERISLDALPPLEAAANVPPPAAPAPRAGNARKAEERQGGVLKWIVIVALLLAAAATALYQSYKQPVAATPSPASKSH